MEKIEYRTRFGTIKQFDDVDELANVPEWVDIIWLSITNETFYNKFCFPPKLEEIYIDNCSGVHLLDVLPETIRFVKITNTYLMDGSVLFKSTQTQIETVNLSCNQIQEFPSNLPENLVSVDLSTNAIGKLPQTRCVGNNISHINLSYNNLTDLPAWLLDLNPETRLSLMPNKFWFNAYSNISLNREIHDYHIEIANRFFSPGLATKLTNTRAIANNRTQRNDNVNFPIYVPPNRTYNYVSPNRNHFNPNTRTTAEQSQNVHNSDIQDTFSKSVEKIMANSAPSIPDYLNKIYWYYLFDGFNVFSNLAFIALVKLNCTMTSVVSRNGVTYGEILERIWAISESHEHKKSIREVLRDEITAGTTVCFTGKVTRLVNTLSGFVENVQIGISDNEQINNAVIACMRRCDANPELDVRLEVKKALDELNVPEERQAIWLDAL